MLKKLSLAALFAAMSVVVAPITMSIAHAQDATEPPSAPNPSDAGAGGSSSAGKSDMSSSKSMKKMPKHHTMMKKKHQM